MNSSVVFLSSSDFQNEFKKCCVEFSSLEMYIAWIGDPKNVVPFKYLQSIKNISAVIGTAFSQSHPDGIWFLIDLAKDVRIANDKPLFHPKVYVFSQGNKRAVFIGSSNLTYQGFYVNQEVNTLIQTSATDKKFNIFLEDLWRWKSDEFSMVPDAQWLKKYRERYKKEDYNVTAWLTKANWQYYFNKFKTELELKGSFTKKLVERLQFFEYVKTELPLPWTVFYFDDLEKRRLIGGMGRYGWLGHVAASGNVRKLMTNGTLENKKIIVNTINEISKLDPNSDGDKIKTLLEDLVRIGPTMKVWSRLLALVRPDLYCTISGPDVRRKISNVLGESQSYFETVDGYLRLIDLIHNSPWYKSNQPKEKDQKEVWSKRAAFLDIIFY